MKPDPTTLSDLRADATKLHEQGKETGVREFVPVETTLLLGLLDVADAADRVVKAEALSLYPATAKNVRYRLKEIDEARVGLQKALTRVNA